MKFTQVVPFLFASLALATPAPDKVLKQRSTQVCGQWTTVETGTYTLWEDQWGISAATSGSQCATINSVINNIINWSTSWTWLGGPYSVKSYTNVALTTTGQQLSSISSIPTLWDWRYDPHLHQTLTYTDSYPSYTGSSIVGDVSYDMFTAASPTGSNEFEIMVWLAALGGAGPISSSGGPIASPTIGGYTWNLYSGPNGATTVYSFVAQSQINNFSGDLRAFYTYLINSQGFSASQYITGLGAGTEPFTGSNAVLSISSYSVSINTGAVATTKTSSTTPTTTATGGSGTIPIYSQCGGIGWSGSGSCVAGLTCTELNSYYSQCL
jgi:xyloglucan-specific endo-beta-1,4-glucanase